MSGEELFDSFIKIRYRKLPLTGNVLWPIIDMGIPGLPQPIVALVDSGAATSILHEDIVNLLRLPKREGKNVFRGTSASGTYEAYVLKPLSTKILGHEFNMEFSVIKNNRNLIWPCILGHNTIFRLAKLEFRSFKEYFRIAFRTDIN